MKRGELVWLRVFPTLAGALVVLMILAMCACGYYQPRADTAESRLFRLATLALQHRDARRVA